jgi:hypothetical protein
MDPLEGPWILCWCAIDAFEVDQERIAVSHLQRIKASYQQRIGVFPKKEDSGHQDPFKVDHQPFVGARMILLKCASNKGSGCHVPTKDPFEVDQRSLVATPMILLECATSKGSRCPHILTKDPFEVDQ